MKDIFTRLLNSINLKLRSKISFFYHPRDLWVTDSFCNSYSLIVITRVVYALGTAITVPVATAILAEWFTSRELPFVNGITISFVSLGNTLAYVATVPIATVLSWRAPIIIYGAFALTCALSWMIFGKERRREKIISPDAGLQKRPDLNIKQVLTRRSTIVLALAVMGAWCLSNAMGSWLPTYYHDVFNMPLEKASSITAIITITGIIASFGGGMLSMRIGRRWPFLMISGLFMGLFALFSVLFNNGAVILVSLAFFGLFANLQNAVIYTIPMELPEVTPRVGAVAFSFMLAAGNFGNFLGPLIVGYLTDWTGSFLPGFIICAVISLTLFVAGVILPETGPGAKRVKGPVPAR